MEQIRKRKLQAVLQEIRLGYMDSIVDAIVNQPKKSYDDIAREHGVSRQFLLNCEDAWCWSQPGQRRCRGIQ